MPSGGGNRKPALGSNGLPVAVTAVPNEGFVVTIGRMTFCGGESRCPVEWPLVDTTVADDEFMVTGAPEEALRRLDNESGREVATGAATALVTGLGRDLVFRGLVIG